MTENGFRLFLHWLIDQEAATKSAVAHVAEDRDVWKARATALEERASKPNIGLALGVTAAILGALGIGFGLGFGTATFAPAK
jgi:hypothetical protein